MKKSLYTLFDKGIDLINATIGVIIALAVFAFIWGIAKMFFSKDNPITKKEARAFMLYGVLTLFVMTSFWGLVNLLNDTIKVEEYKGDVNFDEDKPTSDDNFKIKDNMDQRAA